MTRRGVPLKWTPERVAGLRAHVEVAAEALTRVQHRFGVQDAVEALRRQGIETNDKIVAPIVHAMQADGLLEYRGATHLGWSWSAPVPPPPTLATLVDSARGCISPDANPKKGRRSEFDDPNVEVITEGQFNHIETVAKLLAKYTPGANGDQAGVTADLFGWDETAMNGRGDWALCGRVAEYSDRQHREKHDAKPHSKPWDAKKNTMRTKHLGSARLLLNLAACRGWIPRSSISAGPPRAFAVHWGHHVRRWQAALIRRFPDASPAMIQQGVSVLARYATRIGASRPSNTPWLTVKGLIVADSASGVLATSSFGNARFVWRLVLQLLAGRFEISDAWAWPTERDSRVQLVEDHLLSEIVDHYHDADVERRRTQPFDFSRLLDEAGNTIMGLVNGTFGLRDWLTWSTETEDYLVQAKLPPREFIDPDDRLKEWLRRAEKMIGAVYWLSPSTLLGRLRTIFHYAGWCQSKNEADWCEDGLDALVDPDRFRRYAADLVRENEGRPIRRLALAARSLAIIASPYLEARATQRADTATDHRTRKEMRQKAKVFRNAGVELRDWASKRGESRNTSKDIGKINALWSERGGCSGFQKLLTLRGLLVEAIEDAAGGMSISDQIAAIRQREFAPSLGWATAVRAALLVALVRIVPMRSRTLAALLVDWFRPIADGSADIWNPGVAVQLCVPVKAVKGGHKREQHLLRTTDYEPYLIPPDKVGHVGFEDDFLRPLWELYLMAGGARAFLLTPLGSDTPYPSPYLFVASARSGTEGHGRKKGRADLEARMKRGFGMNPKSLSDLFKDLVVRWASTLRLPVEKLKKLQGGLSLHAGRLLFGTYWCDLGEYEFARVRLHHKDAETTRRLYNGSSAATVHRTVGDEDRAAANSLGSEAPGDFATAGAVANPPALAEPHGGPDGAEVEALRKENAELRAKLDRWLRMVEAG